MVCGVMVNQLRYLTLVVSGLSVLMATTARAEVETLSNISPSDLNASTEEYPQQPATNIPPTNTPATNAPATTVDEWMAQIAQAQVQVTGVRVTPTETGLEITLETSVPLEAPSTSVVGNALIADISNAVLALPDGEEFQQANPIEGIALVSVTSLPDNRVRVAITGVNAPPIATVRAEAQGLLLSVAPGTEAAEGAEEAIQVVVTGEQEESYRVPTTSTATRTEAFPLDVPQSIQVIPQEVLEDQGITQIGEALRNISGISPPNRTTDSFGDSFTIRGFERGRDFFVNGLRSPFGGFNINLETANVEQIEVLRGPASVLYGQAEPGGIVNLTTEQPLDEPTYELGAQIGSFEFYRPTLDFSGPLNSDGTVRYRLNFAYQSSESFVDFVDIERYFVAPVLDFQLSENTTLALEGIFLDNAGIADIGLPALGTVLDNPLGEIPRERFLGDPEAGGLEERQFINAGYRLNHQLSDRWTLRNAFRYDSLTVDQQYVSLNELASDNRTVNRSAFEAESLRESYILQTDVVGTVNTGNLEHELLFGIEVSRVTDIGGFSGAAIDPIDVFDPVYGVSPGEFDLLSESVLRQSFVGVYAQDLIRIGNDFNVLLGGRFDWVDQTSRNAFTSRSLNQGDTAFSPRIGVVYQPTDQLALYGNFSRSFAPSGVGSRNPDGAPFDPTTGEQFEVGVKTELFDGGLIATLAAYQLTKQNIITPDPNRPGFSLQVGEQRSRGIEFDVIGSPLPGLDLIATYAYIDAEITEDNSGIEGNRPVNVAEHSASLWAVYEIQEGDLEGLGFGAGLFFVGDRQGNLDNSFTLPSFVRTDVALYYRRDNWRVGLNVNNLFDVDYFTSSFDQLSVYYGEPLTIQGTVSVTF
jgi:iron complex outermembrane recepter protein